MQDLAYSMFIPTKEREIEEKMGKIYNFSERCLTFENCPQIVKSQIK
jgi:hypothetical protein